MAISSNSKNVASQTNTVPTVGNSTGFAAVQTYTYDELNRLKSATENVTPHGGSQSQSWKQTYTFDRYGNRRFDFTGGNTTSPASNCTEAVCNPTVSTTNNRLTSTGYLYDDAGNTTRDAEYRTFTYDGENKQTLVKNSYNSTIGEYFYDGDGKRVKKVVPSTGETTVFVYDAAGKLIGEYSTIVASANDAKVAYLTSDHLGSPRITTDAIGQTTSRRDFMPYGEEITRSNYGFDSARQKFTGYSRDSETALDFAEARMHVPSIGRFSSPDLLGGDASLPQSLNRYIYVLNNPLIFVDPSGLIWLEAGNGKFEWVEDSDYYDTDGNVRDAYKDRVVANGTVTFFGIGWGDYGKNGEYDDLRGGWVTLNDDGTLSAARDPNLDFVEEVEIIVFESTFPQTSLGSWFGHVAYNINGEAWSWELHGWAGGNSRPTFERYMSQNTHRSATGYVVNGGADFNRQLATLLKTGYDGFDVKAQAGWGGYSATGNNCGESFCRAGNALGLPKNTGILPASHGAYIEREFGSRGLLTTINRYPRVQTQTIMHPAAR